MAVLFSRKLQHPTRVSMIPEPRSTKPKSYKEALTLPKTPEKTESPYDGTLNSTPMRIARGGRSAEAVAVGVPCVGR